jgi:acyl-CoA thioesterase II
VTTPLDDLVELLDLEPIEVNIFRGVSPDDERQRVFGGQVAGQALVAAARTVDNDHRVHSLHAYFLRPGDPSVPILYEVDRIRDGRSFTTRRVVAIQHGRAIFNLAASFHVEEPGLDHEATMPEVPAAETLPTFHERYAEVADAMGEWYHRPRPIDLRHVEPPGRLRPDGATRTSERIWLRADGRLPDDPLLHTCILTYASDMTLLDTALLPHRRNWQDGDMMMASLDHAMWFHRPFRVDEWMLYDQDTPSASGARGLSRGLLFTADGHLAVSVVQEGLIRSIARP